jgi:hypothetical protein
MTDLSLNEVEPGDAGPPEVETEYVKVYTVEEASRITGVPVVEIVDSVRTGAVRTYVGSTAEPAFPVPFTNASVRHRSLIRITEDELEFIHVDLDHRWQYLDCLESDRDPRMARGFLQDALIAWYGAALDDPGNREAAGVIRCLKAFAGHLGLREDGTAEDDGPVQLKVVA